MKKSLLFIFALTLTLGPLSVSAQKAPVGFAPADGFYICYSRDVNSQEWFFSETDQSDEEFQCHYQG